MNQFSWPVLVLAVITLLAGAMIGDALRAASASDGSAPQDAGFYVATTAGP